MADQYELRLPCLQVLQGDRQLYSFAVDGKRLHDFATVARIGRDDDTATLHGYQRPEVLAHIRGIQRYLEKPGALLPNAIVIAFDSRVTFEPLKRVKTTVDYATPGTLVIPIDETAGPNDKPGWIVDGQQRTAAIRDARLDEFPVCVVSFVADEPEQRAQFILVNNTKPLPKGLIYELLPGTHDELPLPLMRKRLAAEVVQRLNTDRDSPFRGLIATPTHPDGGVKDNAHQRMVESSVYNGALYAYRYPNTGEGDMASMLTHLRLYWTTVKETFPDAWALPPRKSRLMHGVGIAAMGYVMDHLTEGCTLPKVGVAAQAINTLSDAAWTTGDWDFDSGPRTCNGLQNTHKDVRLLTNHLLRKLRDQTPA